MQPAPAPSPRPASVRTSILTCAGLTTRVVAVVVAIAALTVGMTLDASSDEVVASAPAAARADHGGHVRGTLAKPGDAVHTSFGAISVRNVDLVGGMSAKSVAGQTHGIQSFIPADKMMVTYTFTIYNASREPVKFDPAWFRLIDGDGAVRPVSATIRSGRLQPDAGIDGQVSFVKPRDGSHIFAEFREPGTTAHPRVDLGSSGHKYERRRGDFLSHSGGAAPATPSSNDHEH